jgi:hypothetical protein
MRPVLSFAVVALLLGSASRTEAVEVYFNGVEVGGLKNQAFEHCSVRFDASGNVHITAKGYTVKRLPQGGGARVARGNPVPSGPSGVTRPSVPPTPAPTAVTKKYFLYSRASRPGLAQYDIDVYVNGKWIRKIRNTDSQVVTDITRKLRPGRNVVQFAATKNYRGKSRLSTSAGDYIQVFVGAGTKGGGTVNITSTLAQFKATASTTANFGQEQTINAN